MSWSNISLANTEINVCSPDGLYFYGKDSPGNTNLFQFDITPDTEADLGALPGDQAQNVPFGLTTVFHSGEFPNSSFKVYRKSGAAAYSTVVNISDANLNLQCMHSIASKNGFVVAFHGHQGVGVNYVRYSTDGINFNAGSWSLGNNRVDPVVSYEWFNNYSFDNSTIIFPAIDFDGSGVEDLYSVSASGVISAMGVLPFAGSKQWYGYAGAGYYWRRNAASFDGFQWSLNGTSWTTPNDTDIAPIPSNTIYPLGVKVVPTRNITLYQWDKNNNQWDLSSAEVVKTPANISNPSIRQALRLSNGVLIVKVWDGFLYVWAERSTPLRGIYSELDPSVKLAAGQYNGGTIDTGSEVEIFDAQTPLVCNLSATKGIVAYTDTALGARVQVVNKSNLTITLGASSYSLGAGTTPSAIFALSATKAVALYGPGAVVILDISGDVITVGTPVSLESNATFISGCRLTATKFFVGYVTTTLARGVVATVTGSTISLGTPANASTANSEETSCTCLVDNTTVILAYHSAADTIRCVALAISGTSFSISDDELIDSDSDGPMGFPFVSKLDSARGTLTYFSSADVAKSCIVQLTGSSLSVGNILAFSSGSNPAIGALNNGRMATAYLRDGTAYVRTLSASGLTTTDNSNEAGLDTTENIPSLAVMAAI